MASTIGPQGSSAAAVAPGTGSPSDPLGALLCRRPVIPSPDDRFPSPARFPIGAPDGAMSEQSRMPLKFR
jgi:hypothetical protein